MTAPGWEGQHAQECISACFQTTAAAKRLSAPPTPSHEPLPRHAFHCPYHGLAHSCLLHNREAGDTNCRLCLAAALHGLPCWCWPVARCSPLASPSTPKPLGLRSHSVQLPHTRTGLQTLDSCPHLHHIKTQNHGIIE